VKSRHSDPLPWVYRPFPVLPHAPSSPYHIRARRWIRVYLAVLYFSVALAICSGSF